MTIKSILEKALGLVAAVAQDAAAPSQPSSKGGSQSLAAHDKVYHPNGYKQGDRCKLREGMFSVDDLVAAPTGKATAQGAPIQNGKMLPHSKMPSEKEFDRVIAAVRNNPRLVPPTLAQSLADFPKNIMQMSEDQEYLEQSIAMLPDGAAKDLLQDKADAMDDAHTKAIDQFLKDFTVLQAIFPEGSNISTGKGTAAVPAAPATSQQQKTATAATPPQQSAPTTTTPSQPPAQPQATQPQPQMPPNNLFTNAGFFVGRGKVLPTDTFSDLPYLDDPNMRAALTSEFGVQIRDQTDANSFFGAVDISSNGNVTYDFNFPASQGKLNSLVGRLQKAGYQNVTVGKNGFGNDTITIPMQSFAKLPPMNHGVPAAKSGPAQPTSQTTQAATASTPPAPSTKQQPPPTQATTPSSPAPKAAANTPSTTTSAAKPTAPTTTSSSPSPTTTTPTPLKGTPLKGFDKTVSAVVGGGFNKKNVLQDTVACIVAMKVPNSLNIKGQGSMTKNSPLWIEFPSNATAQNVKDIEATLEPIYSPFGYKVKAEDFGNKQYLVIEPTAKSLVKQKASKKPSTASSTASAPQPAQAPTSTTSTPPAASTASSGAPSATTQSSPSASTATKGANLLSSLAAKNPKMAAVYSKAAARMAGTTPTPAAANSPAAPVTSQTTAATKPAPANIPQGVTPQQASQIARFQNMVNRATANGLTAQAKSFQAALNRYISSIKPSSATSSAPTQTPTPSAPKLPATASTSPTVAKPPSTPPQPTTTSVPSSAQNSTPTSRAAMDKELASNLSSMTPQQATKIVSSHFDNIKPSGFPKRARTLTKAGQEEATQHMAAVLKTLASTYPNAVFPRLENFYIGKMGNANGVFFGGNQFRRGIMWCPRTSAVMQREDAYNAHAKVPWSISSSQPQALRNMGTIIHELSHSCYDSQEATFQKVMAGLKLLTPTGKPKKSIIDKVSRYSRKSLNEFHSELVAKCALPTYQKGTLPSALEAYVYEEVLGMKPGTW